MALVIIVAMIALLQEFTLRFSPFAAMRDFKNKPADVLMPQFRYVFIFAFHALPATSPLLSPHPRAKKNAKEREREKGREKITLALVTLSVSVILYTNVLYT